MTPREIRSKTLDQLDETLEKMLSAEWVLSLEDKPEDLVMQAGKQMLEIQAARLRLRNAELTELRDALVENEDALEKSSTRLNQALENLNRTKTVLNAVSAFLGVVTRIASAVA